MNISHNSQSDKELEKSTRDAGIALVVDPDPYTRQMISDGLREIGFAVMTTDTEEAAFNFAVNNGPSIVITEVDLAGMVGYQLCRRLRQEPITQSVPVIFVSAKDGISDRLFAFDIGADDFIPKPFDIRELKARVLAILRRSRRNVTASRTLASAAETISLNSKEAQQDSAEAFHTTQLSPPESAPDLERVINASPSSSDLYRDVASFLQSIVGRLPDDSNELVHDSAKRAEAIVREMSSGNNLINATLEDREKCDLSSHAVNVAVLSAAIGRGMKLPREEQCKLTTAALVHDIGMSSVPENIIYKPGELTRQEFAKVKEHPTHGYKMLQSLDPELAWVGEVVYQEHERENGQGYPRGLKGEDMHDYARIIGVADIYDSLSHNRSYRGAISPAEALRQIISLKENVLSSKVIKALMDEITMYPVGTYVRLNSNEIGKVIAVNQKSLLRPVVAILFDSQGNPVSLPKTADLCKIPLLAITETIPLDDITH